MEDVLRLFAPDGPVAGVGVLVALAWLIVRLESTRSENAAAHAAITRNIDAVKGQLTKDIDGVKQDVRDVKQDVRDVKQDVRMLTSHLLNRKSDDNG